LKDVRKKGVSFDHRSKDAEFWRGIVNLEGNKKGRNGKDMFKVSDMMTTPPGSM
jgi:hypothetical protein